MPVRDTPAQSSLSDVLERLKAWEVDDMAQHQTAIPANVHSTKELQPPSYGGPQRDAIASIVDGVVADFCCKLAKVRETLDRIEQQALESAANAKGSLNDHIVVCVKLNDEIEHMGGVVGQIESMMKAAQ
jgi:hypothetical protein